VSLPSTRSAPVLLTAALAVLCSPAAAAPAPEGDPLAGASELSLPQLIRAALAFNPSLEVARATAAVAQARPAVVGALEDPMVALEVAPLSAVPGNGPFGAAVRASQKVPLFGRRGLQRTGAELSARAAAEDVATVQLLLREAATMAWADWFIAHRALETNAALLALATELLRAAEARYAVGGGMQDDVLEADLMRAELELERVELQAALRGVAFRINALLHRPRGAKIPPPPDDLRPVPLPDEEVVEGAHQRSPALRALRAREEAAGAEVSLAERNWLPELEVMGSYSSMWAHPAHRLMVGVGFMVPLQAGTRRAERAMAEAERVRMSRERVHMEVEVRAEVEEALEMLRAAQARAELQSTRVVPLAAQRVQALRAGLKTGTAQVGRVLAAERALAMARLELSSARADVLRRYATLQRLAGLLPQEMEAGR
jgi:cobalt-zinc-cadmium efflux system outer membrane protein